jgi:uncharacterized protein YprB with RNaseH-like and TPR domain
MKFNIAKIPKDELIKMGKWKCPIEGHAHHSGLEHPNCYKALKGEGEKVGFLDIETSGLQADFAIVLSYCIKILDGKILGRQITQDEIRKEIYDKNLLKDCVEDMRKFDKLIYFYGDRFDIPTLRTRSVFWGLDFPLYKEIKGTDVYPIIRYKFNLHRNRLETACDFFGISCKKHRIRPDIWFKAMAGDKKALNWIFIHNQEDVISLEKLYKKVIDFSAGTNKSI